MFLAVNEILHHDPIYQKLPTHKRVLQLIPATFLCFKTLAFLLPWIPPARKLSQFHVKFYPFQSHGFKILYFFKSPSKHVT
jgi:hypothetical protein